MKRLLFYFVFAFLLCGNLLFGQNHTTNSGLSNEKKGLSDQLTVAGTATDDVAILQIDNRTPSVRNKSWEINVTAGTVKDNVTKTDITLSGLPSGLDYTVAKGTVNSIVITLTGAANTALSSDKTITAIIKGSAVTESGAQASTGITLKLWYIGPANCFTITDEGESNFIQSLIDSGCTNLYGALTYLYDHLPAGAPTDLSSRMDRLIKTIESCNLSSEVYTASLNDFTGGNSPVGINADGTFIRADFSVSTDYSGEKYTTYDGNAKYTYPLDFSQDCIYMGSIIFDDGGVEIEINYFAFAIAWSDEESAHITVAGTATDDVAILQIDNRTPSVRNKSWEINVTAGTVKANVTKTDITLSGLPSGFDYMVAKGTGNSIVITLTGKANTTLSSDKTITATIKGSAVTESGAQASTGISLQLWYGGPGTTVVLSNEEGGLIDQLIADGYGDSNLYETLNMLQDSSHGLITDKFMEILAACPAGSEIFTAPLNNYTGLNNPVGINTDGTLTIVPIFGRNYYGKTGYSNYPTTLVPVGLNFIAADSPEYYIDAGSSDVGGVNTYYYAFAIAWSPSDTFTVAGTATDDVAILQIDNKTPSERNKSWEINITKGTVKSNISSADITLSGLPTGFDYTAAKGTDNTIIITLTGAANTALSSDKTITAIIKGSAVTEPVAENSEEVTLYLWNVGEATTFVMTNEGGLIDRLISAGNGDKNIYDIMELLKPVTSGIISNRFMQILVSNDVGSKLFTTNLNDYAGANNPICINADGSILINPIFGKQYDIGFILLDTYLQGVGKFYITTPSEESNLIDAGTDENGIPYKAFAIAWKPNPDTAQTVVMTNEGGLIDSLIAAGYGDTTVYNVLVMLAPLSGGVITNELLQKIKGNNDYFPEVLVQPLKTFGGSNNPVCISTDGKLTINNIFGKDYYKREGFATYPEQSGAAVSFTYAISPEYYIDAGYYVPQIQIEDTTYYQAIAIIWKDTISVGVNNDDNYDNIIFPNPANSLINVPFYIGWEYQIYDVLGNCVQTDIIKSDKINISRLSTGFYTIRFFNEGRQVVVKMMKE